MPKDTEASNPLLHLYHQLAPCAEHGCNARDFLHFIQLKMDYSSASFLEKQKLQTISLQAFHRLDRNQDGRLTLEDIFSQQKRLRRILAPTPSADVSEIINAARRKFRKISKQRHISTPTISQQELRKHFRSNIPSFLPFRPLIAQVISCMLLEIISPSPIPFTQREISEDQWIQIALRL